MRAARRDRFISSAQVAFHYGGYTLAEALTLSRSERELLLAVVVSEQDRLFERIESALGTSWDTQTLAGINDKKKDPRQEKGQPKRLPTHVKIPMLLALAPEFFKAVSDEYRGKYKAALEAQRVMGRVPVVDLGTLSAEDARAFYQRIGREIAKTQPPAQPLEDD